MDAVAAGIQWKERLMAHMVALCKGIGPRQSAAAKEHQAAEYVKKELRQLGYTDIEEQTFKSPTSMGWSILPILIVTFFAVPIAWVAGPWGKVIAMVLFFGSAYTYYQYCLGKQPFYNRLVARGDSQNILCHIPAAGKAKRTIYLIGHMDSQKERFFTPTPDVRMMVINVTLSIVLLAFGGLIFLADLLTNNPAVGWWEWLLLALLLVSCLAFASEEMHPHVEGANDNATAVSVLLAIAEDLRSHPLQTANVQLLFTGCEEVLCVGMEHYLRECKPPLENTYWIDLEMVGTGNLCYITQHGISYLTHYNSHPEMIRIAEQTAMKHPELRFIGKPMIIVEEVANLHARGYRSICLAGYNEKGHLPNWHRQSDRLENIEPDTLCRAGLFTRGMLDEIDSLPVAN